MLDRLHGLPYCGRHGSLCALTQQVDYQLTNGRVVLFYGGDDASLGIPIAAGLMQNGVGADEVQKRPKSRLSLTATGGISSASIFA